MAHESVRLKDRRRSKNSFRPRSIFAWLSGLSTGIAMAGRPMCRMRLLDAKKPRSGSAVWLLRIARLAVGHGDDA